MTESRTNKCPECKSRDLHLDENRGEHCCNDCGLVIESGILDQGAEWRNFADGQDMSRVGMPENPMFHDKGKGTTFNWKETKGGQKTRSQFYRMNRWQQQSRIRTSVDRNLSTALQTLKKVSDKLGIGEQTMHSAADIYRRAVEAKLIQGRSNESMIAASIYASTRLAGSPRTLAEISQHSRVGQKEIGRCYRFMVRKLKIKIRPPTPQNYVDKICSDLELPQAAASEALDILNRLDELEFSNGRNPIAVAASSIYVASIIAGHKRIQREIAEVANVTEVTIRSGYREIVDTLEIELE